MIKRFNPRPCVRGDVVRFLDAGNLRRFQSTPLREGRQKTVRLQNETLRFQSTPLREGRLTFALHSLVNCLFQSTPLREGRLDAVRTPCLFLLCFNPRPCVRGDQF